MSREVEVRVPDIGDFEAVDVVEILVAPGDRVGVEDPLVSLESDKATMEVPSPVAGEVLAVKVSLGDAVSEGSLLVVVAASEMADAAPAASSGATSAPAAIPEARDGASPSPAAALSPAAAPSPAAALSPATAPPMARFAHPAHPAPPALPSEAPGVDRPVRAHAGPGMRRFARELGVDLAEVAGSGPHGRVLEGDLKSHVRSTFESGGARPAAVAGGFERTADVTDLEAWRRRIPTPSNEHTPSTVAVALKAALAALRAFPELSAAHELEDGSPAPLTVAVEGAGEGGDGVALISQADTLGVRELERALHAAPASSRATPALRLTSADVHGGRRPQPVRAARERFALAIGPVEVVPRWSGSPDDALGDAADAGFEPRLEMPIAIDVAPDVAPHVADRFLDHWAEILSAPARLLL